MNEDFEIPIGELPLLNPDPFSEEEHTKLDGEIYPGRDLSLNKGNVFAQGFIVLDVMQSAAAAHPDLQKSSSLTNSVLTGLLEKNKWFTKTVDTALDTRSFAAIRSLGEWVKFVQFSISSHCIQALFWKVPEKSTTLNQAKSATVTRTSSFSLSYIFRARSNSFVSAEGIKILHSRDRTNID